MSEITNSQKRKKKNVNHIEPMPKSQLHRIMKAFRRQGGIIIISDEIDKLLERELSEGITLNASTILLHSNPSRSAVFEELIHATQFRLGVNDGTQISRLRCEIEAQKKLINNKNAYNITDIEDKQTRRNLEHYILQYNNCFKKL